MYKTIILLVAGLAGCVSSFAQQLPSDFKVQFINQPVKAFKDTVDLSTPLSAYITMAYMMSRGEQGRWRSVSARSAWERLPDPSTACDSVSERVRNYYLNQQTYQVITYKDSVARVTAAFGDSGMLTIRGLIYQNNRWVNLGEDIQADSTAAYNKFVTQAEEILQRERDRNKLKILRSDTTSFADYLRRHGSAPKAYLLEKLGQHKVVIYGELHKRKHSWDFLRSVLADKRFADRTGTIFLELPSFTRDRFEAFLNAPEPDPQILLDILRQEQIYGWEDRGEYEFMLDVWKLNRKLVKEKRIRIIPVDNQLDWSTVLSQDDYKRERDEHAENRDHHMARTIAEYLQHDADGRNSLFVVGFNHARKYAIGMGEGVGMAGKQLAERMPAGAVFSIFTHAPVMGNTGVVFGRLRNGLYDYLFETITRNRPVAFDLADSPFGTEPLDLFDDFPGMSTYKEHYDGYMFLLPLDKEPGDYFLPELFTDDFVEELKRRARIAEYPDAWYDMPAETLSKEQIIQKLEADRSAPRWVFPID